MRWNSEINIEKIFNLKVRRLYCVKF